MDSPVRKMLKKNDYNRHKLLRKIKRKREAEKEQLAHSAEKELKKRLKLPRYEDGKYFGYNSMDEWKRAQQRTNSKYVNDKPLSGTDPVANTLLQYYTATKGMGALANMWTADRTRNGVKLYRQLRLLYGESPQFARDYLSRPGMLTSTDDPACSFLQDLGYLYVRALKNPVGNILLP